MDSNIPVAENPNPIQRSKRVAFVVASTEQGTFICNRLDYILWKYRQEANLHIAAINSYDMNICGTSGYLLEGSAYDTEEGVLGCKVLDLRRKHHGDGVVALDCGANIGVFSVLWGRHMGHWGQLVAFEPQERIYYALCGNIALNNCWNVQAVRAAVCAQEGALRFAEPDYTIAGGFSSLSLMDNTLAAQDADPTRETVVRAITIDSLHTHRLDFLKLDLEGMECEALRGAAETIQRFKPVISVEVMHDLEHNIAGVLREFGYATADWQPSTRHLVCVHPDDPIRADLACLSKATGHP